MITEFTQAQINEAEEFILTNLEDGTDENPLLEDGLFCNLMAVVHQQHKVIQHLNERLQALESSKPQAQSTKRPAPRAKDAWRDDPMVDFQDIQLRRLGVDPESVTTKGEAQDLIESLRAKAKAA